MGARGGIFIVHAGTAAVVVPASAGPARTGVCVSHPAPQDGSVVCVRQNAHTVDVCDRKDDGHRAYARVVTRGTYPAYRSPYYDANDHNPGCTNLHFDSQVVSVAVCVQTKGCERHEGDGRAAAATTPRQSPRRRRRPPRRPRRRRRLRHHRPRRPRATGSRSASGSTARRAASACRSRSPSHKRKGKSKPRVKRVVFYYRKNGSVVARSDRSEPYKRRLLIHLAPGPHHVYARVYYKRRGSSKLRKETVKRRFTVCA